MLRHITWPAAAWCLLAGSMAWAQEKAAPVIPATDFTGAMAKMVGGLALVLGVMAVIYWLLRRFMPGPAAMGGGEMRILGRLGLGPRKQLMLVQVADRVLVLGVGGDRISLVDRVDDPEALRRLTSGREKPFAKMLRRKAADPEEQP